MIEESRIPTIGDRSSAISNDGMDGTTAGQINALTAKSTVVDADVTLIEDSAAGYAKKKSTFGTIKEWIMDWVATFIVAGTGISTSYNDAGDALTINATGISATDEVIQDSIGGILGASLIYDDATPRIERAALTGAITAAQNSNATSLGSFTKAQLDTAVSDGNVLYVGDLTQYTDEMAQDAIGLMIDNTLVYIDATPLLQRAAITGHVTIAAGSNSALLGSFTKAQLDAAVSDGNVLYVGDVTQYTDEMAQDAVGAMVNSSLVYTDATPLLERAALTGAITASQGSNTTSLGSFTKAQLDAAVSDGDVVYSGDAISNLTGTKAQFNTAVSDGDIVFLDSNDTITGTKTFSTAPVLNVLPTGTAVASAATASTIATRNSNANILADNFISSYTSTATAAGTTTLTVDSTRQQRFTGSTTQTLVMPVTSTLQTGFEFEVINDSTGAVTINSSGGNAIVTITTGQTAILRCIGTSLTTAADWDYTVTGRIVETTLPITFVVNDTVAVPSGDTDYIAPMYIPVAAGQVVTLVAMYARINSGTSATVKLQKAGVDITGYTGLSVTTSSGLLGSGTTTFTNAQQLSLVVTAVSGTPKNMSVTVFLKYQGVIA